MEHEYSFVKAKRDVFVIETHGLPFLAFEACGQRNAAEIIRSRKLTQAIDRFCADKCALPLSHYTLRAATDAEATIYNRVAVEFADSPGFLVAYLPSLSL